MIPIIPLIWIAIWAIRAQQKTSRERTGAAPSPVPATHLTLRGVVLVFWCFFGWIWIGAALATLAELTLLAWITRHAAHDSALVVALTGLTPVAMTLVAPAVVLVAGPRWLAWRVLRPLGLRRTARCVAWLAPFLRARDLEGLACLSDASRARPVVPPPDDREAWRLSFLLGHRPKPLSARPLRADSWTICARAVEAALQGDVARADLLVGSLEWPPRRARGPRVLRVFAFEALAACAANDGRWDALERWMRAGRGRGVRLWRLLARAQREPQITAARLWLTWLLAPERRRTLAHVRAAATRRRAPAQAVVPPPAAAAPPHPFTRHVELLCHASLGAALDPAGVLALLSQWDTRLGTEAQAAFRARAIELGVADGAQSWQGLRERVCAELELLLDAAGVPTGALEAHGALGTALGRRLRERLFAGLQAFLDGDGPTGSDDLGTPLEEWERWVQLRAAAVRLEERAGVGALQTAWRSGLRDAAWNRPCLLFNTYRADAAQACHAMFTWAAQVAGRLGDEECARVNTGNAALAANAMP